MLKGKVTLNGTGSDVTPTTSVSSTEILIFHVGEHRYGLLASDVPELARIPEIALEDPKSRMNKKKYQ